MTDSTVESQSSTSTRDVTFSQRDWKWRFEKRRRNLAFQRLASFYKKLYKNTKMNFFRQVKSSGSRFIFTFHYWQYCQNDVILTLFWCFVRLLPVRCGLLIQYVFFLTINSVFVALWLCKCTTPKQKTNGTSTAAQSQKALYTFKDTCKENFI